MRKSLLTLGALVVAMSANAQFIQNVGDGASVTIQTNSLLYNGGGVKVVGTGVVKNSGNVMIVGGATSKYSTVTTAGADKTDGGNFILVMTDTTSGNYRYGQLYIEGLTQDRITGIVDKQYKDDTHGTYQQMALPFYQKKFSELNDEFGKTFSNTRWTQDEILVNNNKAVRADHFTSLSTQTTADATSTVAGRNANTAYYMIGAKGLDLSTVKTIKGVPYAEGITETLQDAGKDINFAGGYARNVYKERYRTYLQDQFAATAWAGDYGRNIYQFGNPFLTNLELSY
ncbi:MAG: T9SS C-terminal target domain-containing protein, partial [Bergeyella zoohelcum]|nr:T9SS C-terminal target domain-containing protein [Bergeyella zoohelcum]